ncbi:MAG: NIPSNAP family protein [Pseudomonadota bacterium]
MEQLIEIRTYALKAGTGAHFARVMREQSLPLLRAAGTEVVTARPSLHSEDAYVLMRAYQSGAQRELSQQAFYGSAAWQLGPREAVMACIDSYATVVLPADPALLASLRASASAP